MHKPTYLVMPKDVSIWNMNLEEKLLTILNFYFTMCAHNIDLLKYISATNGIRSVSHLGAQTFTSKLFI